MKIRTSLLFLASSCLTVGAAGVAGAQTTSADAPAKVIRILREEVKPARGSAHEKHEAGWPAAFAKANYSVHYIAMTSMSGPSEAWFIEPHDSFASLERADQEAEKNPTMQAELEALLPREGEFLSGGRAILARYREDLSYRPTPVNIGKAHYVGVYSERVKPGYGLDYEESAKMDVAAYTKAGITNERWIAYQVAAGAQLGTFLYFSPWTTLAEADIDNQKAYDAAMGDSGRLRQTDISRQSIASREFQVFAVSPKMSYLSKEAMAADPDFWNPKPVAKPPAGKAEAKPKP